MERKNENISRYRLLLCFISIQFLHVLATKRLGRFWLCDFMQSVNMARIIEIPIYCLLSLALCISFSEMRPPLCLMLRCNPLCLASDLLQNHNPIFVIWNFLWSQWESLARFTFCFIFILCTYHVSNLWFS